MINLRRNLMYKIIQHQVKITDLIKNKTYSETFDYIVIAVGHYATPNVPNFDGLYSFNGRVLHSHDFRDPEEFKNQHILIIGSSYGKTFSGLYYYSC